MLFNLLNYNHRFNVPDFPSPSNEHLNNSRKLLNKNLYIFFCISESQIKHKLSQSNLANHPPYFESNSADTLNCFSPSDSIFNMYIFKYVFKFILNNLIVTKIYHLIKRS